MMWSAWLISFLLVPGAAVPNNRTQSKLTCVNDYMTNVSCDWFSTAWPTQQHCLLIGTRTMYNGDRNRTCVLSSARHCWIDFKETNEPFSFSESMDLMVMCNGTVAEKLKKYHPGSHVKLHPPMWLPVSGKNLTWTLGARTSKYLKKHTFELQVKSKHQNWKDIKPISISTTSVVMDDTSWCPNSECQARVRVKTTSSDIKSEWSDWSPSVTWNLRVFENKLPPPKDDSIAPEMVAGLVALILVVFISSIVCICRSTCMRNAVHIPDPSKYFQPLIVKHKGNFQQWLGPQYPKPVFYPPQSYDCEISPVDEVSAVLLNPSGHDVTLICDQQEPSGSSGISNMGYFYSEHKSGTLCVDTCPVYFSYHPEGGAIKALSSYEHLERPDPISPDSGFGVDAEKDERDKDEREDKEPGTGQKECSGVNVSHLVSFVLFMPESARTPAPSCLSEPLPWQEEAEDSGTVVTYEQQEDRVVRPSSMVVQPCSSGYLTLKEMQKYSNKSI